MFAYSWMGTGWSQRLDIRSIYTLLSCFYFSYGYWCPLCSQCCLRLGTFLYCTSFGSPGSPVRMFFVVTNEKQLLIVTTPRSTLILQIRNFRVRLGWSFNFLGQSQNLYLNLARKLSSYYCYFFLCQKMWHFENINFKILFLLTLLKNLHTNK